MCMNHTKLRVTTIFGRSAALFIFLCVGFVSVLNASKPGALDPSFGAGDKTNNSNVPAGVQLAEDVTVQRDGKIVAVGSYTPSGGTRDIYVCRFNPDGSVDTSFDGDGKVKTVAGIPIGGANDLVVQPDAKYVVVGANNEAAGFSVIPYNANGSLDTSFGSGGVVFTDMDLGGDNINGCAIYGGDLITAGRAGTLGCIGLAKYKLMPGPILSADYDGDGKSDYSIFRPTTGTWYVFNSATNTYSVTVYGLNGDIPVDGDFDGDSRSDLCLYRPSNGTWYRINSYDGSGTQFQFGLNGDKPVPGDYDKDGKTDSAVWRPSTGLYFIQRSSDNAVQIFQWGANGDIPLGASAQ